VIRDSAVLLQGIEKEARDRVKPGLCMSLRIGAPPDRSINAHSAGQSVDCGRMMRRPILPGVEA
jgi:hypothetical protein